MVTYLKLRTLDTWLVERTPASKEGECVVVNRVVDGLWLWIEQLNSVKKTAPD